MFCSYLWTEIKTSLLITNFHLLSKWMTFCCQAAMLFSFHRRRGNFWRPKTCLRSPVCIIFKNVNFMLCCLILSNLILIFHDPLSSFQCCKCNLLLLKKTIFLLLKEEHFVIILEILWTKTCAWPLAKTEHYSYWNVKLLLWPAIILIS